MKPLYLLLIIAVAFTACKTEPETDPAVNADMMFTENSKTVLANVQGWESESLDYSMYADDFVMLETAFGSEKDSIGLAEMKGYDKQMWEAYDFEMVTDPVLLPGVNPDTKEPDGSVRHYSTWKVIKPATDSTEARSGEIKLYESFDFDEEGKIIYQQIYGDFTGLMMHLHNMDMKPKMEEEEKM